MLDESKRQRAMRPEVKVSRQALGIVQPVNRRIGDWQATAARLIALGTRSRGVGGRTDKLRAETQALAALVKEEMRDFEERTRSLPTAVANSSRILDTGRALSSVSRGLEEALRSLSTGGH